MQSDWNAAIEFVLKMEGGYTLDPNDPGGETMFGVARNRQPQWAGWQIVDAKRSDPNFPKNLEEDVSLKAAAMDFFKQNYWDAVRADELASPYAISAFDTAVNQGVGKARRILQIALGVTVDGVIGDKTIAATFKAEPWRVKRFLAERLAEYARLMAANQNLLVFATNWSYRVVSLAELVLKPKEIA